MMNFSETKLTRDEAGTRVRLVDLESDYAMFEAWWAGHGVAAPPRAILPAAGVLVEAQGKPVMAAWLYQDNSVGVAFLGWFVSNPGGGAITISQALKVLLDAVDEIMRSQERQVIFCMSDNGPIGRRLQRHGYAVAHTATQYCKEVPPCL